MKKLVLTLVALLAFGGSIFAQTYESHWSGASVGAFPFHSTMVAFLQIDGNYIGADGNWADWEMAAFVNGVYRGHGFMYDWTEDGDPYPIFEDYEIYYTNAGETLTFVLYDHANDIEYTHCTIFTEAGGPITALTTGVDHAELYSDYDEAIVFNFTSSVSYDKYISGYTSESSRESWYLISSPIGEVTASDVTNMTTGSYDLYLFDQTQNMEWINYKDTENGGGFSLLPGKGYLYANISSVTLTFTGTPYDGSSTFALDYDSDAEFPGWNLVGNPYGVETYIQRPYYRMNDVGVDLIAGSGAIQPMEGIFVQATAEGQNVTFSTSPAAKTARLYLNLSQSRNVIDRAVVNFGNGTLAKFQLNPNSTKVYIPMEGKDYAVVNAGSMGEMPVNFKAESNGTYTLSFNAEEVTFGYLHLIDNMTGVETDLLANPSYTFDALTTDYESRFKLVFATGNSSDEGNFAYYSNGNWVINNEGRAMLQVVDVNGRILKSESINGCTSVNFKAAAGIYMIRLMNGDNVKVQKVVVK